MAKIIIYEDEVRDGYIDGSEFIPGAKQLLGFDKPEKDVQKGTGQIYTFKQLGFTCKKNNHKPDGWYFPKNTNNVAIILETKSNQEDLSLQKHVNELLDNIEIANSKYKNVVGILYNGKEQRVFLNKEEFKNVPKTLQNANYYLELFFNDEIDTKQIYLTTMKINNLLHYKFGCK